MDQPFSTHQHNDTISAVGYSPTGDQLAVGGLYGVVTIYQTTTHTVIHRLELGGYVFAVSYSPDGKYFAAGGDDKKVTIFSASDFRMVRQIEFDDRVLAICFAADSRHMAVGGGDKKVSIFDTSTDFTTITEVKQDNFVWALSYSPNGKSLLVGLSNNINNTIAVLDATNYTIARQTNVDHYVWSISHSLTGKYIAVGSYNKTMIYEADNLTSIKDYDLRGSHRAAFHPNGTLTIARNNTIDHFDTSEWNDDSLFHAAETGDIATLQVILSKRADLSNTKGPGGITALMKASEKGHTEAIKVLLHSGANINTKDNQGKTALVYASEKGQTEAYNFLIENGADMQEHKGNPGGINDSPKLAPDRLGYHIYAEGISTVAASVENPSASLCVGLIAPWGSGKTFLWRLIKECLVDAAKTRSAEIKMKEDAIKKEEDNTKQPVSRLKHTVVLALAAWCWVARMLVRIFCLASSKVEEGEVVQKSSVKEEEKVATMMIIFFPIGIVVWIICFLCVIMFHVTLFMLKVAPEALFVPFKAVCCCGCCGCGPPLERVKTLWKHLSEVEEAGTDPVIPDKVFYCWQQRGNTTASQRQNEETQTLLSDAQSTDIQNEDVESQNQEADSQTTALKWSQVRDVLTGGGEDIFSNRDFEHISFCGQIQITFLAYFQKIYKAFVAALFWTNFMIPKNYKIEEDMIKYIFVDFNAWVYSGTDLLWAKLIEMLWASVEHECGKFSVRWHRASISLSNEKKHDDIKTKYNKRKAAIIFYVMEILIASLFGGVMTCIIQFGWTDEGSDDDRKNFEIILSSLSFSPTLYFIVKFSAKVVPEMLKSRGYKILNQAQRFETFDRPDFSPKTGFMGEVEREVNYLFDFLRTTYVNDDEIKRRRPIRLAVFLDDLDRCPKDVIVKVLEAVILLLVDAPITCYLAIDTRLVVTSIEDHFGNKFSQAGLDGYKYLEKIIQLPFCVPDLDDLCKMNFLTKTLEGDMLDPLKLYQRLMHLHSEKIQGIVNTFVPLESAPRDTKEANIALIPCLEKMIEENIFHGNNTLLRSPEEALKEISKLSFNSSPEVKKRIQDEFCHWISIGIENVLVMWRDNLSPSRNFSVADDFRTVPMSDVPYVPVPNASSVTLFYQWISKGKEYVLAKWRNESSLNNPDSGDGISNTVPQPRSDLVIKSEHEIIVKSETTPLLEPQTSYDTLFTPLATSEELGWFRNYAKYFVGKPRKMKRIINSYMVARIISNLKKEQAANSLAFDRKLLKFTILLEQWPYRMAWILLIVEIFQHEKDLAAEAGVLLVGKTITPLIEKIPMKEGLGEKGYEHVSLIEIYIHIVQVLVHSSDDSVTQLHRDGDAQVFQKMLLEGGDIDMLKIKDISLPEQGDMDSLRQYAFNLQRHTIEKVAVELESCVLGVVQPHDIEPDWRVNYQKKSKVYATKN